MAAALRVADVIRSCWEAYNRTQSLPPHVVKAMRHILACRTKALGGHIHQCDQCGSEVPMYNSCQDRHCPTCQTSAKEKWLSKRRRELLPVEYFHSVFTLPHSLNGLIDANRRLLLGELFGVVNWVLQAFAHDPRWRLEGELGFLAVLHTWDQKIKRHFHLHCIVPGGVWREHTGQWVHCRTRCPRPSASRPSRPSAPRSTLRLLSPCPSSPSPNASSSAPASTSPSAPTAPRGTCTTPASPSPPHEDRPDACRMPHEQHRKAPSNHGHLTPVPCIAGRLPGRCLSHLTTIPPDRKSLAPTGSRRLNRHAPPTGQPTADRKTDHQHPIALGPAHRGSVQHILSRILLDNRLSPSPFLLCSQHSG